MRPLFLSSCCCDRCCDRRIAVILIPSDLDSECQQTGGQFRISMTRITTESVSKHKMKWKYRKFWSAKTIPENAIVACRPFYEVDFFDPNKDRLFADVFTQSGPTAGIGIQLSKAVLHLREISIAVFQRKKCRRQSFTPLVQRNPSTAWQSAHKILVECRPADMAQPKIRTVTASTRSVDCVSATTTCDSALLWRAIM